jgi:hypothetical protein
MLMFQDFNSLYLMLGTCVVVIVLIIIVWAVQTKGGRDEMYAPAFTSLSALNLMNNDVHCLPGSEDPTGAFSGGCFTSHRVII